MRFVVLLLLLIASGCTQRSNGAGEAARRITCGGVHCYEVGPLGPEWRTIVEKKGRTGYFNTGTGGVIQSNVSCRKDAEAAPLSSLTAHMLIGYTERRERSSSTFAFARREALRSVIEAKLDGVPVVLDLYVLKSNGCVFDLSYVAPPTSYPAGLSDFRGFVDGFVHLPRPEA